MVGADWAGGARTGAHVAHALLVEQLAGGLVGKVAQKLAEDIPDFALDRLLLHPDARRARLCVQVQADLRLHITCNFIFQSKVIIQPHFVSTYARWSISAPGTGNHCSGVA